MRKITRFQKIIVLVVASGVLLLGAASSVQAGVSLSTPEAIQYYNINATRAQYRKPVVTISQCLTNEARAWAATLAKNKTLAHQNLETAFKTYCPGMRWLSLGENVGYGADSQKVFNAFMGSPTHKATILNSNFKYLGVGAARSSTGTLYIVQEFAQW